jgi:hypothetical protein
VASSWAEGSRRRWRPYPDRRRPAGLAGQVSPQITAAAPPVDPRIARSSL